jgi:isocitrate/isopropylmalate dehydrogenase
MKLNVLLLPGDGIGVEVTREAEKVLKHVANTYGHELTLHQALLGGIAIHKTGTPFPDETRALALEADATLMGAGADRFLASQERSRRWRRHDHRSRIDRRHLLRNATRHFG